jgi:acetyl-CoA carboxylase biotin carboxyl carrier protein
MQNGDAGKAAGPHAAVDPETTKFAEIGRAFAALMAACGGTKVVELTGRTDFQPVQVVKGQDARSPSEEQDATPKGTPVKAPLNGTFYRSASPGKPELAKDGATVKAGDACCIVEAMKLFNPIKATATGTITFVAKHGSPVAKGDTLAVIA